VLDYYKIGSWQEEKGPLNKPSTNQILYKKNETNELEDITYKFWRKRK
jgi:anaerobic ribonucleoside-triphosphate reductase activating protein